MEISSVLRGLFPHREALPGVSPATGAEAPPADAAAPNATDAWREVLASYDVREITPRQFTKLVGELQSAGVLDEAALNDLAAIRLDLDLSHADPDSPLDLIDFIQDKLQRQERELARLEGRGEPQQALDRGAALSGTLRQLDWLNKFAALHASAPDSLVDALV
jgi:hypothetical protein